MAAGAGAGAAAWAGNPGPWEAAAAAGWQGRRGPPAAASEAHGGGWVLCLCEAWNRWDNETPAMRTIAMHGNSTNTARGDCAYLCYG